MAGRKAQPVQLIEANQRKHMTKAEKEARRAAQLEVRTDRILKPDFILAQPAAAELWDRLAAELIEAKLLNNFTCTSFAVLCDCWARYVEASRLVAQQGITITQVTSTGEREIQNPALLAMTKLGNLLKTYCAEWYLTPAALAGYEKRGKPKQTEDAFGQLLGE